LPVTKEGKYWSKYAGKLLHLLSTIIKIVIAAGSPLTGKALKVPEPCAGKLVRTVLRGRKLPG